MARNRVIYQSEALFVSPNATGAHFICEALTTGLGPTGHDNAMSTPQSPFGGSGNSPDFMALVNPIGLNQDPAITWGSHKAGTTLGAINTATKIENAASLGLNDLANLSGAALEAFSGAFGTSVYQYGGPVGGLKSATPQTTFGGLNNTSGDVMLYFNQAAWIAANTVYARNDNDPAVGIADKNVVGYGVFIQPWSGTYKNLIQQVHRVQSANYSFTINRTDVNTFGQLARIDAIALEPPTVNLDFTYFPTDGFNERNLGFYLKGNGKGVGMGTADSNSATNHLKSDAAGKNFFIVTTPESTDAFNTNEAIENRSVIGLGNGFLSDYTLEASVGSIPTASATIELYNAKSDAGTTGVTIPGVNLQQGTPASGINFSLAHPSSLRGDDQGASPSTGQFGYAALSALKPGDITLELPNELSMFSKLSGEGAIHIQNFSLSLPLSRSPIDRLGTRFAFSRVVDLPVVATMSVSALMSEIGTGNLALILDDCKEHDVKIKMKGGVPCVGGETFDALDIDFKGARIDSESISSDIGSNKSVDFTFTTQIGGPEDLLHGVFISGANSNVIPEHYSIPNR